jgi:hypothetical protein
LSTILGFKVSRDQMRHELAPEAEMSILHVEKHRGNLPRRSADRLPIGQAVVAIGSLSVLCWAIVIIIALGVRALI